MASPFSNSYATLFNASAPPVRAKQRYQPELVAALVECADDHFRSFCRVITAHGGTYQCSLKHGYFSLLTGLLQQRNDLRLVFP
ncbi:MAG: hypothetical protein MZV63_27950 [Marinilabiliales bacterium]|nr:hypothetical protein [Marinilabiliales bacterium]